ncbi:hypothetical protein H4582DRAFT_2027333 [Lactarius indigo]|nr:hypothetical protein H4582DRAFT_2027333 [Lactarius indigo]
MLLVFVALSLVALLNLDLVVIVGLTQVTSGKRNRIVLPAVGGLRRMAQRDIVPSLCVRRALGLSIPLCASVSHPL